MTRRFRALWLPALAVLLPCGFLAGLAIEWLALEREAALRRGEAAVHTAVASVGRALSVRLAEASSEIERTLGGSSGELPPFALPPNLPDPVSQAFLFDAHDQLIGPPSARDQPTGGAGNHGEASALVARAAAALAAGKLDAAERLAVQVFACCRSERDEHGVAYVFYAAWQRAAVYAREPGRSGDLDHLAREMQTLVHAGDLGTSTDVVQMKLFVERAGAAPAASPLLALIEAVHAQHQRQADMARAASAWLAATADAPALDRPIIGALRRGASELAALVRGTEGRRVVMVVEPSALAGWISQWSLAHPGFDIALASAAGPSPHADAFAMPLFADAPALVVSVRSQGADAATDRRRERLFLAAAGGALVLTLFVGYLALRDVSRELRTASLRAAFIAGVTHELKTPLTSIRLLAETLRQDRARPEVRTDLLETIVQETERLSEVVDNVLSSSRIESGTRTYDPKPLSLPAAVRGALTRFEYVLTKEGFELDQRIDDAPLRVCVDRDAFAQAVLNLLSNAVKYSGTARTIRVAIDARGGFAEVSVGDEGIGIAEADQQRIFDSFYRVPEAASQVAGAGLGLSLVRHFADAHGGRVTVRSRPGQGSVFSLWLPLAPEEAGSSAPVPAHGPEQPLTRASGEELSLTLSRDDRLAFFLSNRDGHWAAYVATLDRFPIVEPLRIADLDAAPSFVGARAAFTEIAGGLIPGSRLLDMNVLRLELDPRTGRAAAGATLERLTQDTQYNQQPVVSPDGTLIAYRFRTGAKGGIGVMDASGANERHLLEIPQPSGGPLFWRSKDEVLFPSGSGRGATAPPGVSVLNVRTGAVSLVRQVSMRWWVYAAGRDEVLAAPGGPPDDPSVFRAVSLATGAERVITAGMVTGDSIGSLLVSPDGTQIAYTVYRGHAPAPTNAELRVMNTDGTGDRVLIPMAKDEPAPAAWSHDNRFLLYDPDYSGERARVLNVATGESWALLDEWPSWDSEQGSWAPDGSFLVVTTFESRRVWQMLQGVTYEAVAKLMKK
jgi:signal transduction histidine kinase